MKNGYHFFLIFFFFGAFNPLFANQTSTYELYQSAQKAIKQNDLPAAKKALNQLVQQGPKAFQNPFLYFDIYLQLIRLEINEGFYKDAKTHLNALQKQDNPKEVQFAIGFLDAELKAKEDGSEKAYIALEQLKNQVEFANWPQEQKLFHHSISFQQDQTYDELLAQADEAFKNKQYDHAIFLYEKITTAVDCHFYPKAMLKPQVPTHLYFYLAKSYSKINNETKAIYFYNKLLDGLQIKKDLAQIQFELGISCYKLKDYKNAALHLEKVIIKEQESLPYFLTASLLYIRANLYLKQVEKGCDQLVKISKFPHLKYPMILNLSTLFIECLQRKYSAPLFEHASMFFHRLKEDDFSIFLKMKLLEIDYKHAPTAKKLEEMKQLSLKIKHLETHAKALLLLIQNVTNPQDCRFYKSKLLDEKYSHTKSYQTLNCELGKASLHQAKASLKAHLKKKAKLELIEAEKRLSIAKKMEKDPQKIIVLEKLLQECLHFLYEANE
jgi:hypothetical protein